jgi:hypothetical protein
MKKFKLKKSINEEILQPIVKVTQNENKEDKHYFNQSKYGLINYLKSEAKEGKIKLYESGTIEDEERLKHIIISPCKLSRWEQMDENERLVLRESFISKIQFDFKNQNYLLAIEEKARVSGNDTVLMEHFHLIVSNKTPTGKVFKINYKKSLMNNYIENYSLKETREKLGIKTFLEMKEQKIDKLKNFHKKKLKSVIIRIRNEITTLHQLSKVIFKNKSETMNLSRLQKHYILAQRENIFKEMSSLNSSIKDSTEHIKTINESVKNLSKIKGSLSNQFLSDLKTYQQRSANELNDFSLYAKYEHSFFKRLQQQKLKDKVITQENFLTSICRNKLFWESQETIKRRHIEYEIKNKQIEFQRKIKNIETELLSLFQNKDKHQEIKDFLNSKLDIQKYLSKENNLHLKTTDEIFSKKLDLYNNYISYINDKIKHKKEDLKLKNQDFQNNIEF